MHLLSAIKPRTRDQGDAYEVRPDPEPQLDGGELVGADQ